MALFAVVDTETNWAGEVMSIGVAVADACKFELLDTRYVIDPEAAAVGGMFEAQLHLKTPAIPSFDSRGGAAERMQAWLRGLGVERIFAYNAGFDKRLMPEWDCFTWHDILKLAAYRQHNPAIPQCADCFKTGRLKRDYGVEPILRLLSGNFTYRETHNAMLDALDELKIMALLGYAPEVYPVV